MTALDLVCRAALCVVLLTAATSKLGARAVAELAGTLGAFAVPARLRPATAVAVTVLELAAGALLIAWPTSGYLLALGLFTAFTLGLGIALRAGARVACRCFGASATPIGRAHVVRNALLIAVAGLGALAANAESALDERWPWLLAGALLGGAITRWDDLAFLFGPPSTPGYRRP